MKKFHTLLGLIVIGALSGWTRTYTTNFALTENSISEGNNWLNGRTDGLDWFNIQTTPGKAFGEPSPANPPYTDPTAVLKGVWGPDQSATATVFSRNPNVFYPEVEIRLRSAITAHTITGYEVTWSVSPGSGATYAGVARWNGKLGDWTSLDGGKYQGSQYAVVNGDVVKATIAGNVISGYKNGVLQFTITDNTFTTGNPGIGFDYGVGSTSSDFGFTSFTATDGVTSAQGRFPTAPARERQSERYVILSRFSNAGVFVQAGGGPGHGEMSPRIFDLSGHEVASKASRFR
jgi:hypothetical protein